MVADGFTGFTSFLDLKNVDVLLDPEILSTEKRDMIEIRRLDGIFDEILEPVARPRVFLKIDTQGFDVEVMKGAAGCMERILGLQSEVSVVPIYDGMPHYTEALAYYESCGFSLMNLFIVSRTGKQNILEYDCLMARLDELDS